MTTLNLSPVLETSSNKGYRHYYSLLSAPEREEYLRIRSYVALGKPNVVCAKLPSLSNLLGALEIDHPEFPDVDFEVEPWQDCVVVSMQYKPGFESMPLALSRAKELARRLMPPGMDVYQAVLRLHDYICQNVTYDKSNPVAAHSIIGPAVSRMGVCDGISKLVKHMLDLVGIPALVVNGAGYDIETLPDGGYRQVHTAGDAHAWNMVRIGGRWYHLDVTFDLSITSDNWMPHGHFLVDDKAILRNHYRPSTAIVPAANDATLGYYVRRGACFHRQEDLRAWLTQQLNSGAKRFAFQMAPCANDDRAYNEAVDVVWQVCKHFSLLYHNAQCEFLVTIQ